MKVYDNVSFIKRVEYLKKWAKFLCYKGEEVGRIETSEINGNLMGYLDCLVDMGEISPWDYSDIYEAVSDYIFGMKDELSPYED